MLWFWDMTDYYVFIVAENLLRAKIYILSKGWLTWNFGIKYILLERNLAIGDCWIIFNYYINMYIAYICVDENVKTINIIHNMKSKSKINYSSLVCQHRLVNLIDFNMQIHFVNRAWWFSYSITGLKLTFKCV